MSRLWKMAQGCFEIGGHLSICQEYLNSCALLSMEMLFQSKPISVKALYFITTE